jgi:hypothetical protein
MCQSAILETGENRSIGLQKDLPDGRRCAGGHQYPPRRVRVLDKQDEDENDDENGEEHDYAKGDGDCRVSP